MSCYQHRAHKPPFYSIQERGAALYSADQIAKYFLTLTDEDAGDVMTNLKLQKLLYYAQGFHLGLHERPLFSEPMESWMHGPVVPEIYHFYSPHGTMPIPYPEDFDLSVIDEETREFLDEVYDVYGQFSATKLQNMVQEESPWKHTELRKEISHTELERFFRTRSPSRSEAPTIELLTDTTQTLAFQIFPVAPTISDTCILFDGDNSFPATVKNVADLETIRSAAHQNPIALATVRRQQFLINQQLITRYTLLAIVRLIP